MPNGQRPRRANHFAMRIIPVRLRARRIEHRKLAILEFADRHTIIDVAKLTQPLVQRNRARGKNALGTRLPKQPTRNIDIVHGTVQKNPTRSRREAHKKAVFIVLVGGL
ncbi:hypothetical protein KCU90_g7081, partial [Aureobasidium melanogenum]